ncbi:MAG: hypothetical protein ACRCXT_09240 [Paraclostridium sp.]
MTTKENIMEIGDRFSIKADSKNFENKNINVVELIKKYNLLKNYEKVPGNQNIKCIEEMIELSHEIFNFNKNKRTDNLESEIADTLITVYAFIMRNEISISKVNSEIEYKLKRFDDAIQLRACDDTPINPHKKIDFWYESVMNAAKILIDINPDNGSTITLSRKYNGDEILFALYKTVPNSETDMYIEYPSWSQISSVILDIINKGVEPEWANLNCKYKGQY